MTMTERRWSPRQRRRIFAHHWANAVTLASAGDRHGAFVAAGRAWRYADGTVTHVHHGARALLEPLLFGGADVQAAYEAVRQHTRAMQLRAATAA